jgi:hypothetical protein
MYISILPPMPSVWRIFNITIYGVTEQHTTNEEVRKIMDSYSMEQTMELRCTRWLKKISHMGAERGPQKIPVAWMTNKRPRGRPHQTICHGLASTITDHLDLPTAKMSDWMKLAADNRKWVKHVENKLKLAPSTYKPYVKCQ